MVTALGSLISKAASNQQLLFSAAYFRFISDVFCLHKSTPVNNTTLQACWTEVPLLNQMGDGEIRHSLQLLTKETASAERL